MFVMFLVDLMHEVELGIWRALFTHLLRILNAVDKSLLHELDRRYVHSFLQMSTDNDFVYLEGLGKCQASVNIQ
jgi:hypothetical protein